MHIQNYLVSQTNDYGLLLLLGGGGSFGGMGWVGVVLLEMQLKKCNGDR